MFLFKTLIFCMLSLLSITVRTQDDEIFSNLLDGAVNPIRNFKADFYFVDNKVQEKVDIHLYYECLCGDCRYFDTTFLSPTVEKLSAYLNVNLYPYGNAKTIDKGGVYEFVCQHGPEECYGNKLHACAIDYLGNITKAVFFNSCMMDSSRPNRGSDDEAADECGKTMNVNSEAIKQCAKGPKGSKLLKYYGEESMKVGYDFVPYILINGIQNDGNNFMRDVCAAFRTPPPACEQVV